MVRADLRLKYTAHIAETPSNHDTTTAVTDQQLYFTTVLTVPHASLEYLVNRLLLILLLLLLLFLYKHTFIFWGLVYIPLTRETLEKTNDSIK